MHRAERFCSKYLKYSLHEPFLFFGKYDKKLSWGKK